MDNIDSFGGGGGGFGGGGGGMGDMANNPQMAQMAQAMQQDPELMRLMQDPEVMQKLQAMQQNPQLAMQYMSDPQMAPIFAKLQGLMGGGGGGGSQFGGGASAAPTPSAGKNVINITRGPTQLTELIAQSKQQKKLLAIDYYTTWCGPCKVISPVFNELSDSYPEKCIFAKVDGDAQQEITKEQGIRAFPTFHFYFSGKKVDEFSGANQDQLRRIVQEYAEKQEECPYKHFPLRDNEIVTYPKVKFEVVLPKIKEQNDSAAISSTPHVLSTTDIGQLESIVTKIGDKSKWHAQEITENQYSVVDTKLLQWPNASMSMPLHLLRALVFHPHASMHYTKQLDAQKKAPVASNGTTASTIDIVSRVAAVAETSEKATSCQVAIWTLSNMFSRRNLQLRVADRHEVVLDAVASVTTRFASDTTDAGNTLLLACVGLYINYAILFREDPVHYETGKVHLLSGVCELLEQQKSNAKIVYRLLVIIGTLVYSDDNCTQLAKELDIERVAKEVAQAHSADKNIQDVTKELSDCLKGETTS